MDQKIFFVFLGLLFFSVEALASGGSVGDHSDPSSTTAAAIETQNASFSVPVLNSSVSGVTSTQASQTDTSSSKENERHITPKINVAAQSMGNKLVIFGSSNLPDGTRLGIDLGGRDFFDRNDPVYVTGGTFVGTGFESSRLLPGAYKATVFTYADALWQSPSALEKLSSYKPTDPGTMKIEHTLNIVVPGLLLPSSSGPNNIYLMPPGGSVFLPAGT
jgi:hypothetical protein